MREPDSMMTVGALAEQAGKTPRALRLYEEMGLIRPSGRSEGNYRQYGADARRRLEWIGRLVDLGMSLTEVQQLLGEVSQAGTAGQAMDGVRARYATTLARVDEQMRRLGELRRGLFESLQYLETCHGCPERVKPPATPDEARDGGTGMPTCCRTCGRHGGVPIPELVAGLRAQAPRLGRTGEAVS